MDKPLSILLVEDEPSECQAMINSIEAAGGVRLIGVTNNVDKALRYVHTHLPDAIILDLELHKGGGNGILFLTELMNTRPRFSPYILVTTHNISYITHEQARRLGADFVMIKSQADYCAEGVVEFLRSLKGVIHASRKKSLASDEPDAESPFEYRRRLSAQVSVEIDQIGISPKAVGRGYIIEAILMIIDGHTQNHIAAIARKYSKTDASVERAMQNAINRAWRASDIEDLQSCYTARITSEKGVPTLTEFVFYYANKFKSI
ncbi:MAG: response regulator [Oscillospiraceae bacterium]|nr:response regulator [Oscillospiraceae bacterium]